MAVFARIGVLRSLVIPISLVACTSSAASAADSGAGADGPSPAQDAKSDDGSPRDVTAQDVGPVPEAAAPGATAPADSNASEAALVDSGDGEVALPSDAGPYEAAPEDAAVSDLADAGTLLDSALLNDGPASDSDTGVAPSTEDAGPPRIGYVGRIDTSDSVNGPKFEWPGTQVRVRFSGPAITIQMADYGNEFNVIVDGVLQPTPIIGSGDSSYPLASGLASTTHEVILYRRTEPYVSTTQVHGVTFPSGGTLLPPPLPSSRRLEVIGDSITCGLGALGVGPNCNPTPENEDHYVTYAAVAARALGADLITTAWSGEGVFENYDNSTAEPPLPGLYPYTLPVEQAGLWNFASWQPQAVVLNLGTNDFSNANVAPGYQNAYGSFLATIRGHYPLAHIICANGPLLTNPEFTEAETAIQAAIAARNVAGDENLSYLSFGQQDGSLGYGCDYHPTVAEHALMAQTLEAALSAALGW